uniref:Uncharacterized protein n=1 Tax=Anguilla anguilla TaxID=7936 RepID=A0A0E9RVU7_ANGAN
MNAVAHNGSSSKLRQHSCLTTGSESCVSKREALLPTPAPPLTAFESL